MASWVGCWVWSWIVIILERVQLLHVIPPTSLFPNILIYHLWALSGNLWLIHLFLSLIPSPTYITPFQSYSSLQLFLRSGCFMFVFRSCHHVPGTGIGPALKEDNINLDMTPRAIDLLSAPSHLVQYWNASIVLFRVQVRLEIFSDMCCYKLIPTFGSSPHISLPHHPGRSPCTGLPRFWPVASSRCHR